MSQLAIMAVGRDRPGIVAAVAEVLTDHGLNIEDSQMTVLRGHFTMMLVVGGARAAERERLGEDLRAAGRRVGLELLEVRELEPIGDATPPEATHVVSVYGIDHPGIVHAVAAALGEREVNIVDLNTRLVAEDEPEPLYVMMLEVAVPGGMRLDALAAALEAVAAAQGVEITMRQLERDEL